MLQLVLLIPALTLAGPASGLAGASGPAHLVRDLATAGMIEDYNPSSFAVMNGIAYYAAHDEQHGYELWRTDGTPEGTWLVRDIRSGPGSSTPRHLTVVGQRLYFLADDGTNGDGLWMSDGTAAGTARTSTPPGTRVPARGEPDHIAAGVGVLLTSYGERLDATDAGGVIRPVANLCSGAGLQTSATGLQLPLLPNIASAILGSDAYVLIACHSGQRLWKTDGTSAGTQLVIELSGSSGPVDPLLPLELVAAGGALYFNGADGARGVALWKSDGSAGGTYMVNHFVTSSAGARPRWLTAFDGRLVFASGTYTTNQLWITDGTTPGTTPLLSGVEVAMLTALDTRLLFVGATSSGPPGYQLRLWASDGTAAGTGAIAELGRVPSIARVGNSAYFWNGLGSSAAPGLWSTDGTSAGTQLVHGFTDRLYPHLGQELPWSPRTASEEVAPYLAGVQLTDLNGSLLFRASSQLKPEPSTYRRWLWRSDGTFAGTSPLAPAASTRSGDVVRVTAHGAEVFFTRTWSVPLAGAGPIPSHPAELWKSDGTAVGTSTIAEWPCLECPTAWWQVHFLAGVKSMTSSGERMFFSVLQDLGRRDLWSSDGTPAGTVQLTNGCTGIYACSLPTFQFDDDEPTPPYAWNGRVFFAATDDGQDVEMWVSDGTVAGTHVLIDACPGTCAAWQTIGEIMTDPGPQFAGTPSTLYFTTSLPTPSLWRTDGTPAGTVRIGTFQADELAVAGEVLYFLGGTSGTDYGLWRSDGTQGGTLRIADVPFPATGLMLAGSQLYFAAPVAAGGPRVLWRSDGVAQTAPLTGIAGSPYDPDSLTAFGGALFFSARSAAGRELWRSDGTAGGTVLVADLASGPASSILEGSAFVVAAGRLVFAAAIPASGRELWSSDGTAAGTQLVQDIAPGPASSNPAQLTLAGQQLFFTADDATAGSELWVLPLSGLRPAQKRR